MSTIYLKFGAKICIFLNLNGTCFVQDDECLLYDYLEPEWMEVKSNFFESSFPILFVHKYRCNGLMVYYKDIY